MANLPQSKRAYVEPPVLRRPMIGVATGISVARNADIRNIALLLFGFVLVVAIVPPVRSFPMDDDWVYARSVQDLMHGIFRLPGAQAIALGHTGWGVVFASIFGFSFSILSVSTLVMSATCVALFYLLLRRLQVNARYALLGTALLGCNPIFVYLSYSFMTDVTFLTYTLGACLCFVIGVQNHSTRWFWLGGALVALAYLTRQFGILLVVAALLYLWMSGGWSWRRAVAISVLPVSSAVVYMLWERTQPTPLAVYYASSVRRAAMQDLAQYALDRAQTLALVVAIPGLCLAPLLKLPRRVLWILPLFGYMVFFQFRSFQVFGSAFPANGSIVDNSGYFSCCNVAPIWSPSVWLIIGVLAAVVLSLYLIWLVEWVRDWLRTRSWRSSISDPAFIVYASGLLMGGSVIAVGLYAPFFYDRYFLPVLPALMLPVLRRLSAQDTAGEAHAIRYAWRWLVLVPIAVFAVACQHDYLVRAATRWQGAQQLLASGIPADRIYAGFEWQGWYLYDEGERYIREKGDLQHVVFPPAAVTDPVYAVMELTGGQYSEIGSLPYQSWLEGGNTGHMLLLKRK